MGVLGDIRGPCGHGPVGVRRKGAEDRDRGAGDEGDGQATGDAASSSASGDRLGTVVTPVVLGRPAGRRCDGHGRRRGVAVRQGQRPLLSARTPCWGHGERKLGSRRPTRACRDREGRGQGPTTRGARSARLGCERRRGVPDRGWGPDGARVDSPAAGVRLFGCRLPVRGAVLTGAESTRRPRKMAMRHTVTHRTFPGRADRCYRATPAQRGVNEGRGPPAARPPDDGRGPSRAAPRAWS